MLSIYKNLIFSLFTISLIFSAKAFSYGKELNSYDTDRYTQSMAGKTLYFSNLLWNVREGTGGPGPNNWSSQNAWVDGSGQLHLKISKVNGKWYCPEIWTPNSYGFGTYTFYVVGLLDKLDHNVVLGLFNYTTPAIGPDGTNEIDIEFSRWGDPNYVPGGYTVWPYVAKPGPTTMPFNFTQTGTYTSHKFIWNSKSILFHSCYGHYQTCPLAQKMFSWNFSPRDYSSRIPQKALPMHLNLWLFRGAPPSNGQEVEVVISKFCFQPADGSPGNCPV